MARTNTLGNFLTDVANAIRAKGGTSEPIQASYFDTAIANLPSGGAVEVEEKDVNFFDYDGTIVYSYTKAEFLALESMPENPTHDGLTSQGWNWDLTEAKAHITSLNKLDIGQIYITDDGKTRIYIDLKDPNRLTPYLGFAINGTAEVDWGDGNTQSITSNSETTAVFTQHTYSSVGKYVIAIASSKQIFFPTSSGSSILTLQGKSIVYEDTYENAIYKFESGSNFIRLNYNVFVRCRMIKSMTFHKNVANTINDGSIFQGCENLRYITIPPSMKNITSAEFRETGLINISLPNHVNLEYAMQAFYQCKRLRRVCLTDKGFAPNSIFYQCTALTELIAPPFVNVYNSAFRQASSLSYIKLDPTTTLIQSQAFQMCCSILMLDCRDFTSVPTLQQTNVFNNYPPDFKIVVPDVLYEEWISANAWSAFSNIIFKASDV